MSRLPQRDRTSFVRGKSTWAIYGLVGYFAYMETMLGPLMPFLRTELGLGFTVAALHFSAFASGGVLIGLSGNLLLRRLGRRASLWVGATGMAAGALVLTLCPVAFGTILGALFMGAFGTLLLVTTEAFLADRHGEKGAVAISESNTVASACAIGAPLLIGVFASSAFGWRATLIPPVALLCLLALRYGSEPFHSTPPVRSQVHEEKGTSGEARGGRERLPARYWVFWGMVSLGVACEWCIGYWGADFLVVSKGLSRPGAATALTLFFVAMLAGRILGSRLARRLPPIVILLVALCVALTGFLLFWLSGRPEFALAGLFVTGLGIGNLYPLGVSSALASGAGQTDAAAAKLAVGGGGAVLVAPLVLGALADRVGIEVAFGVVVPMLLISGGLTLIAGRGSQEDN